MPFEPIIPEGQHLGKSRQVDDAVAGNLFDDENNKLQGQAAWIWVDEPESNDQARRYEEEPEFELTPEQREVAEAIGALIVLAIIVAVNKAKPLVQRWFEDTAVPAVKSAWNRASTSLHTKRRGGEEPSTTEMVVASPSDIEETIEASTFTMTLDEWSQRYEAMVVAGAFAEEQLRLLRQARIENTGSALDPATGAEQLTPRQFADRMRLMLEARPALLRGETSGALMDTFRERLQSPTSSARLSLEP